MNLYDNLGLMPSASVEAIRHAVRQCRAALHTDRYYREVEDDGIAEETRKQMRECVDETAAILSDQHYKPMYDYLLGTKLCYLPHGGITSPFKDIVRLIKQEYRIEEKKRKAPAGDGWERRAMLSHTNILLK